MDGETQAKTEVMQWLPEAKYKTWFASLAAVYGVALNWTLNKTLLRYVVESRFHDDDPVGDDADSEDCHFKWVVFGAL